GLGDRGPGTHPLPAGLLGDRCRGARLGGLPAGHPGRVGARPGGQRHEADLRPAGDRRAAAPPLVAAAAAAHVAVADPVCGGGRRGWWALMLELTGVAKTFLDRKSTRLNSSHVSISYAVFC